MDIFLQANTWIALLTLTFLEIVLGIDNIVFISIISNKLKEKDQPKARNIGLILAMVFRIRRGTCGWITSLNDKPVSDLQVLTRMACDIRA